jgi:hypothetical protein
MKWFAYVVCLVLMLGGGVVFLQGMRVLPSRLMYGRPEWVVIGAAVFVAGAAFALIVNRRHKEARN